MTKRYGVIRATQGSRGSGRGLRQSLRAIEYVRPRAHARGGLERMPMGISTCELAGVGGTRTSLVEDELKLSGVPT